MVIPASNYIGWTLRRNAEVVFDVIRDERVPFRISNTIRISS